MEDENICPICFDTLNVKENDSTKKMSLIK